MQNVGLAVILTSDTKSAVKGIKDVSDEFVDMSNESKKAASAVSTSISNITKSQQKLSTTTVNANGALSGFTNIIRDAPYGIIGVGNNITQLTDAFAQLKVQTGSAGGALSALATSIFSPAGLITVGVSLAVSLFTVFAQRQQQAATAAKKLKEETKSLSEILLESNASVQGQIETSKQLGAILIDTNKSYEQRKSALNELQKINKDYFGSLSLEKSSYEDIKKSIDKYADSLIRAATVKGLQDQISKTAEAISKIAPIISTGLKDLSKQDNPFSQFVQSTTKKLGSDTVQLQGAFTRIDSIINKNGRKLAADIGNVADQQNQAIAKTAPLDELKNRLTQLTTALSSSLSGTDTPAKDIKTVADVLAELQKELTTIDILGKDGLGFLDTTNADKVNAYEKALKSLIDLGLNPTSTAVQDVRKRIQELNDSIIGSQTIKTTTLFVSSGKGFQDVKADANQVSATITNANNAWTKFRANVSNTQLSLKTESFRESVNNFVTYATQLSKSLKVDLIAGFAEGLGGLASGTQTMGNLLGNMLSLVGDFAINLGKAAIPIGIAAEAVRNAFSSPAGAIAAGVGLIAVGGLIKGFASKLKGGVPSFAQGGLVEGAQLAVVGDNPGRKEAIIPSEMWGELGGGRREILVTEVGYNALLIKLKQSERNSNR